MTNREGAIALVGAMKKTRLTLPDGNDVSSPDATAIGEVLHTPSLFDPEHGCSECALEYSDEIRTSFLGIRHLGGTRYSLEYKVIRGPDAPNSAAIILFSALDNRVATLQVGGMSLSLPESSAGQLEQVVPVIVTFLESGGLPIEVISLKLSQLPSSLYSWH